MQFILPKSVIHKSFLSLLWESYRRNSLKKMLRIKKNKSNIYKNGFHLFEFIFQILCFGLLSYQFLDITNVYLSFPYEVKQEINDYSELNLPSITFCLKRDNIWLKKNYKSKKNSLTHFFN